MSEEALTLGVSALRLVAVWWRNPAPPTTLNVPSRRSRARSLLTETPNPERLPRSARRRSVATRASPCCRRAAPSTRRATTDGDCSASRCLRLVNVSGGALDVSIVHRSQLVRSHQRRLFGYAHDRLEIRQDSRAPLAVRWVRAPDLRGAAKRTAPNRTGVTPFAPTPAMGRTSSVEGATATGDPGPGFDSRRRP